MDNHKKILIIHKIISGTHLRRFRNKKTKFPLFIQVI